MYDHRLERTHSARRQALITLAASALAFALGGLGCELATAQGPDSDSVVRKISGLSDKLELTTNSSRILTLDKNIPRVQVNNPELLAVTPLSATQVQISAKKAGVTQVNLWDDTGAIHTIDVQIYGDARELTAALQTQFPNSTIKVYRYSESLVLTGFVDRPDHVGPIMRMAEDYAPKVINNISVGGVQQILLKVKVMEISRTKLRQMGMDWAWFGGNGFAINRAGGLINAFSSGARTVETVGDSFSFGIIGDSSSFFGVLDALEDSRVAKILAEPNIVTVSGRPAQFQDGGEFPIIVPQSLGTSSIEFKPFGTQVDFLPIVLGNGNIRLEVRPRISDRDFSHAVVIPGNEGAPVPALTVRQVDTAVEMKAGQTFALAGLVQERTDTVKHGLPYVSDLPVIGVPFRRTRDEVNEIELLIMVTPELVEPMDAGEEPCNGPGTFTTSPTRRGLYCGGQMEVPTYCNPTQGLGSCGGDNCGCNNGGCSTCNSGGQNAGPHDGQYGGPNGGPGLMNDSVVLPGGTGYDDSSNSTNFSPTPASNAPVMNQPELGPAPGLHNAAPNDLPPPAEQGAHAVKGAQTIPVDITLPVDTFEPVVTPPGPPVHDPVKPSAPPLPPQANEPPAAVTPPAPAPESSGYLPTMLPIQPAYSQPGLGQGTVPQYTAPRPYSPQRQPVFMRNATRPYNPQPSIAQPTAQPRESSLIGPVGYDVQ